MEEGIQHDQTAQRIGLSTASTRDDYGPHYSISSTCTNIESGTNHGGRSAALQKDPDDRGVVRDGNGRYNNAFWADTYSSVAKAGCSYWVPHMYGYSGIVVALIPNGTAYYYASDNQEFTTTKAIQESDRLIPICGE